MRKIDTNNHFIDKSDLDHIKNRLHFAISNENLEELILLLYSNIDMRNIDTIQNIKNELEIKIRIEAHDIKADVEIDDEIEECITDFLKRQSVNDIIYHGVRNVLVENDDDPESAVEQIIDDIIDEISNADLRISTEFDVSNQVTKICNDILTEVLDEYIN